MTLGEELIKLAATFVGITLLGGALAAFWTSRQKRRETEGMELKYFYDHYGQLLAACRLWNSTKSGKLSPPSGLTRYELLKQASEAESALEGMLFKLASDRLLAPDEQSRLGRFRQAYQAVREAIRDDHLVQWESSEDPQVPRLQGGRGPFRLPPKEAFLDPIARRGVGKEGGPRNYP